jgi:hypothetical protein
VCPICWNNLPKKPQELPCGHEFCRGCILDLQNHAKTIRTTPSCPMCRGPIQKDTIKSLWKDFQDHEKLGETLMGLGSISQARSSSDEADSSSLSYLTVEAEREYDLAALKLGKCLELMASPPETTQKDVIHNKKKVQIIMALQRVLQFTSLHQMQYAARMKLLQHAIHLSNKPLPEAHLELGKVLRYQRGSDNDNLNLAVVQFQTVLDISKASRLATKTHKARSTAKKLRGDAHFGLAVCYQLLQKYGLAADEYDFSDKFKSCRDYGLAAKCHSLSGNLVKAMAYGKKALKAEENSPLCDTHLIMIRIYDKFFLMESEQGNLLTITHSHGDDDTTNYKYTPEIDHFVECVIRAKDLTRNDRERGELTLHMESLKRLLPWKVDHILSHFPMTTSSACNHNSRHMLVTSPSEDTLDSEDTFESDSDEFDDGDEELDAYFDCEEDSFESSEDEEQHELEIDLPPISEDDTCKFDREEQELELESLSDDDTFDRDEDSFESSEDEEQQELELDLPPISEGDTCKFDNSEEQELELESLSDDDTFDRDEDSFESSEDEEQQELELDSPPISEGDTCKFDNSEDSFESEKEQEFDSLSEDDSFNHEDSFESEEDKSTSEDDKFDSEDSSEVKRNARMILLTKPLIASTLSKVKTRRWK